jgi:hypothetical protein
MNDFEFIVAKLKSHVFPKRTLSKRTCMADDDIPDKKKNTRKRPNTLKGMVL